MRGADEFTQPVARAADDTRVTVARQVFPNRIISLVRRTTQGGFLTRPSKAVNEILEYCLAEAAARYEVQLLGWTGMSNHVHLLILDKLGNYPEFIAHLNKMTAKALNRLWGRWENLWSTEQPSVVHCATRDDAFAQLVYILANSINADAVDRVTDWPGICSYGQTMTLKSRVVVRPNCFFKKKSKRMPPTAVLEVKRIPGFEHLSDEQYSARIARAVRLAEHFARARRAREGTRVWGRKAVLAAKPTDSPATVRLRTRGEIRPTLACKSKDLRMALLGALLAFREAYRDAWDRYRGGATDVVFPVGTFRMRKYLERCAIERLSSHPPPALATTVSG